MVQFDSHGGVEVCLLAIFQSLVAADPDVSQGKWVDAQDVADALSSKHAITMPTTFVVAAGSPDWEGKWLIFSTDQFHVGMHQQTCRPLTSVLNTAADIDAKLVPTVRQSVAALKEQWDQIIANSSSSSSTGDGAGHTGVRALQRSRYSDLLDAGSFGPAAQVKLPYTKLVAGNFNGGESERRWAGGTFARVRSSKLVNFLDIQAFTILTENRNKTDNLVKALIKSHTKAVVQLPQSFWTLILAAVELPVGTCPPASTSDNIDDSNTSLFDNSRTLMGCANPLKRKCRRTPSVSSRGRSQASSALYADVRLHIPMTHRNDSYNLRGLHEWQRIATPNA